MITDKNILGTHTQNDLACPPEDWFQSAAEVDDPEDPSEDDETHVFGSTVQEEPEVEGNPDRIPAAVIERLNRIPIEEVARSLGLQVTRDGDHVYVPCPNQDQENDDENPRCQLGGEKNLARCHKCGWGSNVIGFVRGEMQGTFEEACQFLKARFEIGEVAADRLPDDPVERLAVERGWAPDALRALGAEGVVEGDDGAEVRFPMRDSGGVVVGAAEVGHARLAPASAEWKRTVRSPKSLLPGRRFCAMPPSGTT